jgi:hypothetical protein
VGPGKGESSSIANDHVKGDGGLDSVLIATIFEMSDFNHVDFFKIFFLRSRYLLLPGHHIEYNMSYGKSNL